MLSFPWSAPLRHSRSLLGRESSVLLVVTPLPGSPTTTLGDDGMDIVIPEVCQSGIQCTSRGQAFFLDTRQQIPGT